MSVEKKMSRGVQQSLYKYLPGSWVDFTESGGGSTYAVHVDNWNSVQLTGINNKRLLRVINQQVHEYIENNGYDYNSEKKKTEFKKEDLFALVDFDIENGFLVEGDVEVIFYREK